MQKHLFFLVFCFLTATTITAQNYSLTVSNPHFNVNQRTQGIITSPEITVTPNGAYAQIEMTFTINPQSSYKATDSLEAVLLFDLPQGSFIHDSWLWLNEQVIIKASVVEKNRAIAIYEGIVQRRRDPSLLIKTGPNSYKLNVYPMATTYPRKVKLTYSVPFRWQYDKASVELPVNLFASSLYAPDILVKVKHDFEYATPAFTDQDYGKFFLGYANGEDALLIRGSNYANTSFNLSYTIGNPKIQLYTYPVNPNEGVYQLIVPPVSFGVNKTLNTVFIIDHPNTASTIYTLEQIKQNLRAALLSNYSSRDSFNIFYESGGNIVKAFSTWQHVNLTDVDNAIKNIPTSISTNGNKYEDLVKEALSFCAGKPGADGQVVLLSNNKNYTTNQGTVDAMFNNIKTHIGTFSNKVHVINYSNTKTLVSGVQHNANDIWYSKLTLASGGTLYKYNTLTNDYINGKYTYVYDLNAANVLSAIADNSGVTTSSYNINIGVGNGFTYSAYNLHPVNRMNMSKHFVQTGRYNGSAGLGTTIDIQALSGSTVVNINDTINSISNGNATMVNAWAYHFLADLIGKGNSAYTQEIIDSSIRNRVLCEYTAFLAVETGDTLSTNTNDNPNLLHIGKQPDAKNLNVKCYPNPFVDKLVIELAAGTELLEVFDLMGRKVFSYKVTDGKLSYTWNGRDNGGNDLPSGMYMVVASTATERFTTKVMKQ